MHIGLTGNFGRCCQAYWFSVHFDFCDSIHFTSVKKHLEDRSLKLRWLSNFKLMPLFMTAINTDEQVDCCLNKANIFAAEDENYAIQTLCIPLPGVVKYDENRKCWGVLFFQEFGVIILSEWKLSIHLHRTGAFGFFAILFGFPACVTTWMTFTRAGLSPFLWPSPSFPRVNDFA